MIELKQIYQRFFRTGLIILIIIPSILISQNPPEDGCTDEVACNYDSDATNDDGSCWYASEGCTCDDAEGAVEDCAGVCDGSAVVDACGICEGNGSTNGLCPDGTPVLFQYEQSTLQAFYFFTDITLNGDPIALDDWVAAFNGDICVGARQWDTSSCGGGQCDVPLMGSDGSDYTDGYMRPGDIPTFKIYDSSSNIVFDAIAHPTPPNEEVDGWSTNLFSMNILLAAVGDILGCMEMAACNYDPDATVDDGSCEESDCAGECGGSTVEDCAGECGGEAILDNCNVCDSDLSNDCIQDCAGDWGGDAILDNCGACDTDISNDCIQDCAGDWGGDAILDNCGACDTDISNDCIQDCAGDWGGTAFIDNCDICVGGNTGIAIDSCPLDCAGVVGGIAFTNECGTCICNGSEPENEEDCAIIDTCIQDFFGSWCIELELDDCGRCNGESVCINPTDPDSFAQCVGGEFNVGEVYSYGFDCAGYCFGTLTHNETVGDNSCLDCADIPYGDAALDNCDICSGGESGHIANSDEDCEGTCFGSAVLDECGECSGDGLSCQFGCTHVNATNYYCDVYECENNQLPAGFLDDGTCTYNVEGSIEYFNTSSFLPIKDVLVTIYGSSLGLNYAINSDSTDINGEFLIPHIPIQNENGNNEPFLYEFYYLEFSYTENEDNIPTGINNNDASLILNVAVANTTFAYPIYSAIAADVNLDDRVNANDSYLINKFMNDHSFSMNGDNVRWKFVSEMATIYDITNLMGNENIVIYGIKLGDPNGSWE